MARRRSLSSLSFCVAAVVATVGAVACGSSDDSQFKDGTSSGSSGSSGDTVFGGTSGGTSGTSGTSGGVGTVKPVSATDACASSNAGVDALPIYLVFMVDKSGSMGNENGTNVLATKWNPAVAALKDFFADPTSANIHASLAFFSSLPTSVQRRVVRDAVCPDEGAARRDGVRDGAQCASRRAAARRRCPPSRARSSMRRASPRASRPARRSRSCSSRTVTRTTAARRPATSPRRPRPWPRTIKTYVIGVGTGAANLDTIATGGGTAPHIQVNTTSAATTSADLRAAIGKIKQSQLTCDYALPPPPAGKTIDVNAVNVNYTTGGATKTLPYSATCADAGGWHYDSVTTPTKIIMCPSSARRSRATPSAARSTSSSAAAPLFRRASRLRPSSSSSVSRLER